MSWWNRTRFWNSRTEGRLIERSVRGLSYFVDNRDVSAVIASEAIQGRKESLDCLVALLLANDGVGSASRL
jgi:hypothetical protein